MVDRYLEAAGSLFRSKRELGTAHPFVTACGAAMIYVGDVLDRPLSSESVQSLGAVLCLGIVANDHYDTQCLNIKRYRTHRKKVPDGYSEFFKRLRQLERGAGVLVSDSVGDRAERIIKYRESVNAVSLAIAVEASNLATFDQCVDEGNNIREDSPVWLKTLYWSVMALQVADDMVGYRGDVLNCRPSFYTAFGDNVEEHESVMAQMRKLSSDYLKKAIAYDEAGSISPIVFMSRFLCSTFPATVGLVRKLGLAGKVLSNRDAYDH